MTTQWTQLEEDQARVRDAAFDASHEGQERKTYLPGMVGFNQNSLVRDAAEEKA